MANQLDSARQGHPHIAITPNPALVDQPVHIRLTGFAPDQRVTLQAQMQDDAQQTWQAEATFKTDAAGAIDVPTQQPLAGIVETGLARSMHP